VKRPRPASEELRRIERDLQEAAGRLREEAAAAGDRMRQEARAVAYRLKDEAPRKAIHLTSIVIPLAFLYLPMTLCRRTLMAVAVVLLVTDVVKIHQPRIRSYFTAFFGHLIRVHEREGITGSTYLVVSALLTSYLFERDVAAAAMIYLTVGDTLAAVVGKAWGRTPLFGKSLEGFLAGLVGSFAVAWLLVGGIPAWQLGVAALAAALAEIWPIPVDDNFRIPLLSGLVLELLR